MSCLGVDLWQAYHQADRIYMNMASLGDREGPEHESTHLPLQEGVWLPHWEGLLFPGVPLDQFTLYQAHQPLTPHRVLVPILGVVVSL